MHIRGAHTVTMVTVLVGTGISALSSLMDPASQALTIIGGFAIKAGATFSKAVSPAVAACSMASAQMLNRLYPDRIIRLFGMSSGQEQNQVARMLSSQAQGLAEGELEVNLHAVHTHYIACGLVWLHCPALALVPDVDSPHHMQLYVCA